MAFVPEQFRAGRAGSRGRVRRRLASNELGKLRTHPSNKGFTKPGVQDQMRGIGDVFRGNGFPANPGENRRLNYPRPAVPGPNLGPSGRAPGNQMAQLAPRDFLPFAPQGGLGPRPAFNAQDDHGNIFSDPAFEGLGLVTPRGVTPARVVGSGTPAPQPNAGRVNLQFAPSAPRPKPRPVDQVDAPHRRHVPEIEPIDYPTGPIPRGMTIAPLQTDTRQAPVFTPRTALRAPPPGFGPMAGQSYEGGFKPRMTPAYGRFGASQSDLEGATPVGAPDRDGIPAPRAIYNANGMGGGLPGTGNEQTGSAGQDQRRQAIINKFASDQAAARAASENAFMSSDLPASVVSPAPVGRRGGGVHSPGVHQYGNRAAGGHPSGQANRQGDFYRFSPPGGAPSLGFALKNRMGVQPMASRPALVGDGGAGVQAPSGVPGAPRAMPHGLGYGRGASPAVAAAMGGGKADAGGNAAGGVNPGGARSTQDGSGIGQRILRDPQTYIGGNYGGPVRSATGPGLQADRAPRARPTFASPPVGPSGAVQLGKGKLAPGTQFGGASDPMGTMYWDGSKFTRTPPQVETPTVTQPGAVSFPLQGPYPRIKIPFSQREARKQYRPTFASPGAGEKVVSTSDRGDGVSVSRTSSGRRVTGDTSRSQANRSRTSTGRGRASGRSRTVGDRSRNDDRGNLSGRSSRASRKTRGGYSSGSRRSSSNRRGGPSRNK